LAKGCAVLSEKQGQLTRTWESEKGGVFSGPWGRGKKGMPIGSARERDKTRGTPALVPSGTSHQDKGGGRGGGT